MQCANCGSPLKEGAAFCENCGQATAPENNNIREQESIPQPYATSSNQPSQGAAMLNQPYQSGAPSPYLNQDPSYRSYQDESIMTTGSWFVTMLITAIPIVGIVMILIWAFGSTGNTNRRNYARAVLIWAIISLVLGILFFVVFGSLWANFYKELDLEMYSVINYLR